MFRSTSLPVNLVDELTTSTDILQKFGILYQSVGWTALALGAATNIGIFFGQLWFDCVDYKAGVITTLELKKRITANICAGVLSTIGQVGGAFFMTLVCPPFPIIGAIIGGGIGGLVGWLIGRYVTMGVLDFFWPAPEKKSVISKLWNLAIRVSHKFEY